MNLPLRLITRAIRRILVGADQRWVFEPPPQDWTPSPIGRTSFYLHVPFCRNFCPYCPYTKIPYDPSLLEPYTRAAIAEIDWWADRVGNTEISSIYIGGGTPTVALDSVAEVLQHIQKRFRLIGDICLETNPSDLNENTIQQLHAAEIGLVSLGVQSFQPQHLALLGRRYDPVVAKHALGLLLEGGFDSVNIDLMFALPGQKISDVISDLDQAEQLGANQITTYPLFTFPYTSVGEFLKLKALRMPNLRLRREHYRAISDWCAAHGYERVSVWGFKRSEVPRYSSVTRDGYIGVGPGAGSHLSDGFVLNTFDFTSWLQAFRSGKAAIALQMPFTKRMAAWWWLYWRLYDTCISVEKQNEFMEEDSTMARCLLETLVLFKLAIVKKGFYQLTESGAFWLHLVQNYFALNYVNTLWSQARKQPWPRKVVI